MAKKMELIVFSEQEMTQRLFLEMVKDGIAVEYAPNKFKMIYPLEELLNSISFGEK